MLQICHRAIDLFRSVGTLIFVHDPEGVSIIADLHGDFHNFMNVIENARWPNERTLLFLGDYVDRGKETVELILFILLLKIRYPQRVFMLRGNHETYECGEQFQLKDNIKAIYGIEVGIYLFRTLEFTFDHLPIAALVSDQVYCCHGGISQFSNSLDDIAAIARPISCLNRETSLRELSIITDTLWADPAYKMKKNSRLKPVPENKFYAPNDCRFSSYIFNEGAIIEKLEQYRVRAIIRGHKQYTKGFMNLYGGKCLSVHSCDTRGMDNFEAAVLHLNFNRKTGILSGFVKCHVTNKHNKAQELKEATEKAIAFYNEIKDMYPLEIRQQEKCEMCFLIQENKITFAGEWSPTHLTLSHTDLLQTITSYSSLSQNAAEIMEKIACIDDIKQKRTEAARNFACFLEHFVMEGHCKAPEVLKLERLTYEFSERIPELWHQWPRFEIREERKSKPRSVQGTEYTESTILKSQEITGVVIENPIISTGYTRTEIAGPRKLYSAMEIFPEEHQPEHHK